MASKSEMCATMAQQARTLIGADKLMAAITAIKQYCYTVVNTDYSDTISIIEARIAKLNRNINMGILARENASIETNQIVQAILYVISQLEDDVPPMTKNIVTGSIISGGNVHIGDIIAGDKIVNPTRQFVPHRPSATAIVATLDYTDADTLEKFLEKRRFSMADLITAAKQVKVKIESMIANPRLKISTVAAINTAITIAEADETDEESKLDLIKELKALAPKLIEATDNVDKLSRLEKLVQAAKKTTTIESFTDAFKSYYARWCTENETDDKTAKQGKQSFTKAVGIFKEDMLDSKLEVTSITYQSDFEDFKSKWLRRYAA